MGDDAKTTVQRRGIASSVLIMAIAVRIVDERLMTASAAEIEGSPFVLRGRDCIRGVYAHPAHGISDLLGHDARSILSECTRDGSTIRAGQGYLCRATAAPFTPQQDLDDGSGKRLDLPNVSEALKACPNGASNFRSPLCCLGEVR